MNDKEQTDVRKTPTEQGAPVSDPADRKDLQPKRNAPEPRKRGPSVDIAPCIGPGTDVVVTPPKHI